MATWLLLCKPGFERDASAEITAAFPNAAVHAAKAGSGYLTVSGDDLVPGAEGFVFISDLFACEWLAFAPGQADRIGPIRHFVHEALSRHEPRLEGPVSRLRVQCPETSPVAGLERFCSSFIHPLRADLARHGLLTAGGDRTQPGPSDLELVVVFVSFERCGLALRPVSAGMGASRRGRVAREREAPSRSGSKLAEAVRYFGLKASGDGHALAVDLGAAPGGWTQWLASRGFKVQAVDNGALDPGLLERYGAQITHLRADAFRVPVHPAARFVVCDIVDKPQKVVQLMLRWATEGHADEMVFNLKLPMKQRYEEVARCLSILREGLSQALLGFECRAHQLYHDRQEVTVAIRSLQR